MNLTDEESLEHLRFAVAPYDSTPHPHLVDLSLELVHKVTPFPFVRYVPRRRVLRITFCQRHPKTTGLLDSYIETVRQNCNKALHET